MVWTNNRKLTDQLDTFALESHSDRPNRLRFVTHFKSCDHTLGKFKYCPTFCKHSTTLHGAKYVGEIKRYFIERLIT